MIRRLLRLTIAITLSATTIFLGAGSAAANHLECGTADPHDVLPANGGRVTIMYENQLVRSLAFPNGAVVAGHIKDRAEAALTRYQALDFPVPSAVTIYIKCRLSAAVLYEIDRNGFTQAADHVQLKTDYIQSQFANVAADNIPGSWSDDLAGWKNLVDHEMFHAVHHLMAPMAWDYVAAADKTIVESGATLAQDFFVDVDDLGDPGGLPEPEDSYYGSVAQFLADPKTIASDTDGDPAYQAGAFLQYLGERFGSQAEADLEQRVATWFQALATADEVRVKAMRNAIDPDAEVDVVYDALLDFLIAAYVPDHPNLAPQHKILDERNAHFGQAGTGSTYPGLIPVADPDPVGPGNPAGFANELLAHDQGRVHSVSLAPGTVQVAVTFDASAELLLSGRLYVAAVPIDDGEARTADAQRGVVFPGAQPTNRILQVAGAEVRDLDAGTTTRVSVSAVDVQGDRASDSPVISADGSVVAFQSVARNLIAGDTNNRSDIYAIDLATLTPWRVSVDAEGLQANEASDLPAISADGTSIAFQSDASNLVAGDTNAIRDIFVRGPTWQ